MITKKFEEEYEKLNEKQKEAVDTIEGPVMVIAGPGTGKTTILTLRIANILRLTDTPASGILALTFTDAGVKAMKEKLRGIIGNRALEIPIYTFHGFAMSVIREFDDHFPHLSKSENVTEFEAEKLIRQILTKNKYKKLRPFGDPDYYVPKIIATISEAKREAWTPEMIEDFAKTEIERIKTDETSISTRGKSKGNLKAEALNRIDKCEKTLIFSQIYQEYEKIKKTERKIDFDDMLFELLKAIRQDQLLLQSLQEKYLYIMIDEHQDTNDTQNEIIRQVADFFDNPNIFIVGDEKQAIYRFQGASVQNFLSFQKIWKGMKIISLKENYRSHQDILDHSFKMIEQNYEADEYPNLRIKLKSSKTEIKPIELIEADNKESEEEEIVRRLKEITNEQKEKKVAIIVRKNNEVARIFDLLEKAGIEASAERGANIFSHPLGEAYFSLLETILDPTNFEAWGKTVVSGLWKLNFKKQIELLRLIKNQDIDGINQSLPEISKINKEITQSGVIDFLIFCAETSGFLELIKSPLAAEVWRGIINLAIEIAKTEKIESSQKMIESLLSYKKTAEKRSIKIHTGKSDAQIKIMTAHSSKGLEFDYVFLPYLLEEFWIKKDRGQSFVLPKEKGTLDNLKDDRRLFFVALTRAKEHVILSFHKEDSMGNIMTPLRFIDELEKEKIAVSEISNKNQNTIPKKIDHFSKRKREGWEYAQSVILEKGLSVTALNHFLECPSKFFYKSILKMPEAPSINSERGNAMHIAMNRIWQKIKNGQKIKNEEKVKIIKETATDYFKKSLLAKFEKDQILEEIEKDASIIIDSLQEHFEQKGQISTEDWYEKNITLNGKVFLIHGKLDLAIIKENKVLVYDYKTKKAMTEKAIRGETKNENGNYFRQLIFYKMLMEAQNKFQNKIIEPSLVFIVPDEKGHCPTVSLPITQEDEGRVLKEIETLIKSVWSSEFLDNTCGDSDCEYCKLKKLGLEY